MNSRFIVKFQTPTLLVRVGGPWYPRLEPTNLQFVPGEGEGGEMCLTLLRLIHLRF